MLHIVTLKLHIVTRKRRPKVTNIPQPRTLEQVQASLANAKKQGTDKEFAALLMKHGNVEPEVYRWLEANYLAPCPKCGLLNGHRFPCVS
jgi:hypothetical protein